MLVPKKVFKQEEAVVEIVPTVSKISLLDTEKRPCDWDIKVVDNLFVLSSEVTGKVLKLESLEEFNKVLSN